MTDIAPSDSRNKHATPFWAAAALPGALALGLSLYGLWRISGTAAFGRTGIDLNAFRLGSAIWAGLPESGIAYNMPLFETLFSLVFSLGASPDLVFTALGTALLLLVFCAGAQLRSYRAGLASLALAGLLPAAGRVSYNFEQGFYSLFLLLVLNLLLLKRREDTPRNSLLLGLCVGGSLLIRTPLFLFPAVIVALDLARGRGRPALRQGLLLAGCCLMLAPWAALRYRVTGALGVLDGDRGACNVLTAARGSVLTMRQHCQEALGLPADIAPVRLYISEALADPVFFARSTLRRAWYIFLYYPLLFAAFLAALAFSREKDRALYFSLPVYFLAIHSLLSVESGYFYPMLYLLPPLIAGTFIPGGSGRWSARAGALAAGGAWAALALAVPVQALLLVYPRRAAEGNRAERLEGLAGRFPRNEAFAYLRCERLRDGPSQEAYKLCLAGYGRLFLDPQAAYFASVLDSPAPASLPFPPGSRDNLDYPVMRMLRQAELGDRRAALDSFRQAYGVYEVWHQRLRGYLPGEKRGEAEQGVRLRFALNTDIFWEKYVGGVLRLWPPARAKKIAEALGKVFPPTAGLKALRQSAATQAAAAVRQAVPVQPAPDKRAGSGPEARFIALAKTCTSSGAAADDALRACKAALYLAEAGQVGDSAENRRLAAEAALSGAALLEAVGRGEEAGELRRWLEKKP